MAIRSWWRSRSRRFSGSLEIAAVVIAALLLVTLSLPFIVAQVNGTRLAKFPATMDAVRLRMQRAEIMRTYALAKDSTIGPVQAGRALSALVTRARDEKPLVELASHPTFWRDMNTVARAPAIDVVGGEGADAPPADPGAAPFFALRRVALAGVSRARSRAWERHRDSAAMAFVTLNSFGLAIVDNATSLFEGLGGEIIVGIARDSLVMFYTGTEGPEAIGIAARLAVLKRAVDRLAESRVPTDSSTLADVIAGVSDTTLGRGARYELLARLSRTTCTSAWRLLVGHEAAVDSAFARARLQLARFPSEVALIDSIKRSPERPVVLLAGERLGFTHRVAGVAATILRMPRLRGCTELLVSRRPARWPKLDLEEALRRRMQALP